MARTLLQLVQQACLEIGIPAPSFLFGSVSDQERQLIALAQREGKEFARAANKNGGWQELRINYTFNTVTNQTDYPLPADLEYFVERTFWNNKYKWELVGPITAQERQILTYGVVASGPRPKFYIQQNKFILSPAPPEAQLIAFQYYSKNWCQSVGNVTQSLWMADTDTYLLDEECFIQGIKWRFLRAKGFDYAEEKEQYDLDVQRVISRDGGERDLPLGGDGFQVNFLNYNNIPDSGFGGV
jgi:hypothetical protein